MEKIKFNRIRVILAEKGKSNRWLALILKLNENTVSRWVNNAAQPEIKTLYRIADILDVSVCSLLEGNTTTPLDAPTPPRHEQKDLVLGQSVYLIELFDNKGNSIDITILSNFTKMQDFCHSKGFTLSEPHIKTLASKSFIQLPNTLLMGSANVSQLVLL
jgi:transcriptional regulator with XRE-family HTH domain